MTDLFRTNSVWSWFNDKAEIGAEFNVDSQFFDQLVKYATIRGAKKIKGDSNNYVLLLEKFMIIIEKKPITGGIIKFKERGF